MSDKNTFEETTRKHPYRVTVYACYLGYITQAVVVNLMPLFFALLREEYGLTYGQLGGLVLCNFLVQILSDFFAARYGDRVGYRRMTVLANAFALAGLVCMAFLPVLLPSSAMFGGLLFAAFLFGAGGGMIEVVITPIVDAVTDVQNQTALSLLHSFYCWGHLSVVLLTTLILRAAGRSAWPLLALGWAVIPLIGVISFAVVPLPEVTSGEGSSSIRALLGSKIYLAALVMMVCGGAAEQVMAQWVSAFAELGLALPKAAGDLLGLCTFALFMGLIRMLHGMRTHICIRRTLRISALGTIACYLAAALAPWPWLSLVGCAATGFFVAMFWPGVLTLASEFYPHGGTAMFGVMALAGDIGCSLGPWLAGTVSDAILSTVPAASESAGIRGGVLASLVFPVGMLLCLAFIRGSGKNAVLPET